MDSCCCVTESKKWYNSDSHCIPHFATLSQLLLPFPGPVKEPGVKISSSFTWDKNQLEAFMSLRPVAWLPFPLTCSPSIPGAPLQLWGYRKQSGHHLSARDPFSREVTVIFYLKILLKIICSFYYLNLEIETRTGINMKLVCGYIATHMLCQSQLKKKKPPLKDRFANWKQSVHLGLHFRSCIHSPIIRLLTASPTGNILGKSKLSTDAIQVIATWKSNNYSEHLPEKSHRVTSKWCVRQGCRTPAQEFVCHKAHTAHGLHLQGRL